MKRLIFLILVLLSPVCFAEIGYDSTGSSAAIVESLKHIKELKDLDILTEEEYQERRDALIRRLDQLSAEVEPTEIDPIERIETVTPETIEAEEDIVEKPERRDSVKLSVSLESLSGDFQYEIKGSGVRSRLEFPLDSTLLGPNLTFYSGDEDHSYVRIGYRTNLTDEPGKLRDTDWFYGNKSLLGEVDVKLNLHTASLVFGGLVDEKGFNTGGETGILFQYFKWQGNGILTQHVYDQYGAEFTGYSIGTHNIGPEDWIKYEVYNLHFPLRLLLNYRFSRHFVLRGSGTLLFGFTYDRDDHIYVQKIAKTFYYDLGAGAGLEAEYRYDFFIAALSAEIMYVWGWGQQEQEFYGGPLRGLTIRNIDASNRSQQLNLGVRVGIVF